MKTKYTFTMLFLLFMLVGINAQILDVEGDAIIRDGTPSLRLYDNAGGENRIEGEFDENNDNIRLKSLYGDLLFQTGTAGSASTRMSILGSNGNVGIGNSNPATPLHITTGSEQIRLDGPSPFISFYNGATYNAYLYHIGSNMIFMNRSAGYLRLGTNNATRATITSSGDLGIGTTNPTSKVEISHNSTTTDAHLELYENGDDYARIKFKSNPAGTTYDSKFWDIAGRVGTNTQDAFNLFFYNGASGNNFFSIDPNNNNIKIDGDIVPLDPSDLFDLGNNPSESWDDVVGDDFINTSDRRMKQNIESVSNVLPKLMSLNPVTYEYIPSHNPDGRHRTGFIAQEVQSVFPSVVIDEYVDIVDGQIVKEKSDILAMNYIELIPISIKAIQEQQMLIEELRAEIEELKKK